MKRLALMLLVPAFAFAGEKDTIVLDQPDELIVPLLSIEAQGEANRDPYTIDDRLYFSDVIDDNLTVFLSLAEPDEDRLIEQIIVSVLNDAEVEILICVGGCTTPFNTYYQLATVKGFQQLTFDRPILAEQVRVWCRNPLAGETNCRVSISALLTPE